MVLKGGTALNLFCFEHLPRLSVDIDLNYIGALDREKMLEEKPMIMDAIQKIMLQNQFEQHGAPMMHAGGKMGIPPQAPWLYFKVNQYSFADHRAFWH